MTEHPDHDHHEGPMEGLPYWMQFVAMIGVPSFLLLFLLGAIPGLASPYARLSDIVLHQQQTIQMRDRALRELNYQILQVVRQTCRGMWQKETTEQALCLKEYPVPALSVPPVEDPR